MSVTVEIGLWTKPSWMMDIEDKNRMNVKELKEMGECYGAIYNLSFYKDEVNTEKEVKVELKKLRINPKGVSIVE